jgi:hypothetical protein
MLMIPALFLRLEYLFDGLLTRLKTNPVSTVQDAAFELNAVPCVFSVRKSEGECDYYSGLTDGQTFKSHRTNAGSLVFDLADIYTFAHAEQAIKEIERREKY